MELTDQWGGRHGTTRLVVRLVGMTFFSYVLLTEGALAGPIAVTVLASIAIALSYLLAVARMFFPFGVPALVATVAMMLCGAVINPYVSYLGSVFFVIGGIIVLGQPELSLRWSVGILVGASVVLVLVAALARPTWSELLSIGLVALAVGLFGANRRISTIQRRQEQALAERSRELEARNAELEAQTELTRQEAARAAASEERGRIARNIHDVLAHSLGGLIVQLDAAEAELSHGADPAAVGARLTASRQLAVEGLREARSAVRELRAPAAPTDLVEQLGRLVNGPVGVELGIELDVLGTPRPVPAEVAEALVAVARESLTNINKHAAGSPASATVVFAPELVRLEVVNGRIPESGRNSCGNDLADTGAGAGLVGLTERVAAAGGEFGAGPEGARWVVSATLPTGPAGTGPGGLG